MTSFWGLNIEAAKLQNRAATIEYYRVVQPTWGLVLDDVQLARDIKAASPSTHVIVRLFRPDGYWYTQTPEDYLKFMDDSHVDDDLWCYVENEAGLNVAWNLRLVQANMRRANPRHLVICNLSVGTPARKDTFIEDLWKEATPLLIELNTHRDWLVLGLHEYFNCVPTSGFIGGWPDNAGVEPGKPDGRDLVTFTNWPGRSEARTLSKFHCGRFDFLNRACEQLNIQPPRIVLTEHGQDDVSDIKAWVEKTVGQNIRGFKTLADWWQKTYGWTLDRAYYEILMYLYNAVYSGTNVEGACIYCHGNNGDPQWLPFNVEGSGLVERLQAAVVPPIPVQPPKLPDFPADFDQRAIDATLLSVPPRLIVRSQPGMSSDRLETITNEGMAGRYIPQLALKPSEIVYESVSGVTGAWLPVLVNKQRGWVFGGYLRVKELENPPEPKIPEVDLVTAYNLAWNMKHQAEQLLSILSQGKVN